MHLSEAHTTDTVITAAVTRNRSALPTLHPIGDVVGELLSAVDDGWFELPKGRNRCYTHRQFSRISSLVQSLPEVVQVQQRSRTWSVAKLEELGKRFSFIFGLPNTFPDIVQRANSIPYGGPRRPREFRAGTFQAVNLLHCLQDAISAAAQLNDLMDALDAPDMFDRNAKIENQVARLRKHGQMHYLDKYVYALRGKFLWKDDQQWLRDVKGDRISMTDYDDLVAAREARNEQASVLHWRSVYALTQQLADFFESAGTYHHGTLTRRLREQFGRRVKLLRESVSCGSGFMIELEDGPKIGSGKKLDEGFVFVNFVIALAGELESASPDVHSYFSAEERASVRSTEVASTLERVVRRIDTLELQSVRC